MATAPEPITVGEVAAGEESSQLRMLAEFAPDGVVVMDSSGRIVEWNPSAEAMFGWTRAEAIGSSVADLLVLPRFRSSYERWFRRFQDLPVDESMTERHRLMGMRRDGSEISVEATIWTFAPSDGGTRLCNAFIRDLTRNEEADWMQARLAAIVDASEDAIVGTREAGTIVAWNTGAEHLYGYTAEEAIGQHISILVPADGLDDLREVMARLRRGEKVGPYDTVRQTKSGRRIDVSVSISPHVDAEGRINGGSSIARDITRRKQLEAETRRLNEELEVRVAERTAELERANQRLEGLVASKSDFVASVSHELRTPLTSVIGFAETLMDESVTFNAQQRREIVREIADQGYELANIVEDLLVAARSEMGELQVSRVPVDLSVQTAQVLGTMRPVVEQSVAVCGVAPIVQADPQRVRQILRNLITNAFRYGGPNVAVHLQGPLGGFASVSVCDDGEGIPTEAQEAVFDAYTRAHDRPGLTESFGLGLAISRDLARLMGGDLVYERNGRTEFRLILPVDTGLVPA